MPSTKPSPRRSAGSAEPAAASPPAKPRRAYLPAHERRRRIIAAAQQVFARSNLQGARTRDIAKAAEINQATLFEHFPSKEALFHEAVVEPLLEAMRGMHHRASTYEAAASPEELRVLAQASAQRQIEVMFEVFPLFTAALFSDLELGRKIFREQLMPLLRARAAAIRPLVKDPLDPEIVELAMFGAIFAFAMDRTLNDDTKDPAHLADQLTRIAVTGFARDRDAH